MNNVKLNDVADAGFDVMIIFYSFLTLTDDLRFVFAFGVKTFFENEAMSYRKNESE